MYHICISCYIKVLIESSGDSYLDDNFIDGHQNRNLTTSTFHRHNQFNQCFHIFKRDEKIEDGRDAFLYYREKSSGWLLTHGEDFYSKNGASWFVGKTEGL